jgi:acetylornithine deacetylase
MRAMSSTPIPSSLDLLRQLLAIPTVTRTPNVELIALLQTLLRQAGIDTLMVSAPGDSSRCNLFASTGPKDVAGVMLSGHTDVVPVEGQRWTTPPFEATERDGRIHGRGSADMKGFVACAVVAMVDAAARELRRPLQLALSFDEEIGCVGVRHLLRELEHTLSAPMLCLVGEPTLMKIGTGHKGKSAYIAHCRGQAGHSGLAPRFVNAIHTASDLIGAIRDVQRDLAEYGAREDGYDIPYTTIHAGTIDGGTALNVVPETCDVNFEIRNIVEDDPAAILARILERTEVRMRGWPSSPDNLPEVPRVELTNAYPGLSTAEDSHAARMLASLLPTGTGCTKVPFGSEGGLFQQSWSRTSVLVCGPGSIEVAHKADEYVEIGQIDACDRLMAKLVDHLCEPVRPF